MGVDVPMISAVSSSMVRRNATVSARERPCGPIATLPQSRRRASAFRSFAFAASTNCSTTLAGGMGVTSPAAAQFSQPVATSVIDNTCLISMPQKTNIEQYPPPGAGGTGQIPANRG